MNVYVNEIIRGDEIKDAIRNAIDEFAYNVIPEDTAENVAGRERYNTIISPKVGGGGDDFERIAEKHIAFEVREYDPYKTAELATLIACEYMWERSKRL